jgi:hypothetical protein
MNEDDFTDRPTGASWVASRERYLDGYSLKTEIGSGDNSIGGADERNRRVGRIAGWFWSAGRMRRIGALATIVGALVIAAPASASDEPRGFDFCGWKDFVNGGWTFVDPADGAFLRLYSRNMSCRIARRNYRKLTFPAPEHVARLAGYRCREVERGYEYSDAQFSNKGRRRAALRYETGT